MTELTCDLNRQFCTFLLDEELLAIDVVEIQEIIHMQPITLVPLAPEMIRGLVNLRGQIVTVVDLRLRLGMPSRTYRAGDIIVVVRCTWGLVALLVDEICDMMTIAFADCVPVPDTVTGPVRTMMRCVYKLPSRLLLVLDIKRTVEIAHGTGIFENQHQ
jgi:purine-binding chemotaxis protein CheW